MSPKSKSGGAGQRKLYSLRGNCEAEIWSPNGMKGQIEERGGGEGGVWKATIHTAASSLPTLSSYFSEYRQSIFFFFFFHIALLFLEGVTQYI